MRLEIGTWITSGLADVAESDPGLLLFMLIGFVPFVAMVVVGLMIFAIITGVLMLITGMGIASVSVFIGWYHRSVRKGLNTFFYLCFAGAGIVAALLLLFLLDLLNVSAVSHASFCVSIIAAGAIAGWVCFAIIKRIGRWIRQRWLTQYS